MSTHENALHTCCFALMQAAVLLALWGVRSAQQQLPLWWHPCCIGSPGTRPQR